MSNLPEYRQGDVFFPGDRINDVPIGRACPRDKLQLLNMRRGDPGIELCAACAALFTPTPPGALPPWIVNAPPAPGRAENLVPFRERGLAIALQYWEGDAGRAFRLAELLANIEPRFRNDVTTAPAGSAATPVRPTTVSLGGAITSPPSRATVAAAASASWTQKSGIQAAVSPGIITAMTSRGTGCVGSPPT